MKKYIASLFIIIVLAALAFSFRNTNTKFGPHITNVLDNSTEGTFIVYVYFTDKGPGAQSRLSNPLALVTQKSVDRRLKVRSSEQVVDIMDVPLNQVYVRAVSSMVLNVRQQLKWFNALTVEATKEQLDDISKLSYVSCIDLVERFYKKKQSAEPETNRSRNTIPVQKDQVLVDTLSYGTSITQISQIKVNLVHNQGIFGQGVMIASFDIGWANQTHEAFTTLPMHVVAQYDFQTHQPTAGDIGPTPEYWHGTETLSDVGGYKPGQLIGSSFRSSFLVARTEVDSFERPIEMDNWNAASQWADSIGADIITSSLIYLVFDAGYGGYTWQDMNGMTMPVTRSAAFAAHNGIVVFNCAGNNGPNGSHNTLLGPADADSILTIGSVQSNGIVSSFSSVGPTTDNPPRIKPDVMALGSSNYVATTGSNSAYTFHDGTSYATPMAAGVGGLILSANKSLTPLQVRGILRKFASNSNSPNNTYGWGIIDAQQSVDSARKLDVTPPSIVHTQPFTSTLNTGVISMKARVFDNGIIRTWPNQKPLLYYRTSSNGGTTWSATTALDYNSNLLDTFYFPVPGNPIGTTVQYYFAAQDIALPNPLMSTLPAGGSGINPPGTTAPPTRFQYYVGVVGITPVSSEIPQSFKLYYNYPNPFNPSTKIKFDIAVKTDAKLKVYDITGKEVAVMVNEYLNPGTYEISFDAGRYASGVYFYKLETAQFTEIRKMVLVK